MSDAGPPWPPPLHESLLHLLGRWAPSAAPETREEGGRARGLLLAGVGPGGRELGDRPAAEVNHLRSADSMVDQRAWSLDPADRRSFMLETIRRSPQASATGVQHQELMARLREDNLPEFVERLLTDKNSQIDELQRNVRSLTQQTMRSSSASDRSLGHGTGVSDDHQPSPEVLRRAATSDQSDTAGDLSRPDISMAQAKEVPTPPSVPRAASPAPSPRPPSPASQHGWHSAPTEPLGGSRRASSAGAAASSASGDSVRNLRAALARKKQLLNERKREVESRGETEPVEGQTQPPAASAEPVDSALISQIQQQLCQLRARLSILEPILTRLDADYCQTAARLSRLRAGVAGREGSASETQLRLAEEVERRRTEVERQDQERGRLERELRTLEEQGVPESDRGRLDLEQRLLATLRDMEVNKLETCSVMHEAAALMASGERRANQDEAEREAERERRGPDSDPSSSGYLSEIVDPATSPAGELPATEDQTPDVPEKSGYLSEMPEETGRPSEVQETSADQGSGRSSDAGCCWGRRPPSPDPPESTVPARSPRHSPRHCPPGSAPRSPATSPLHSPERSPPFSPRAPEPRQDYELDLRPVYELDCQDGVSDSGGESAFESGLTEFESVTERASCECGTPVLDSPRSSRGSLLDEMPAPADNSELDRLRRRAAELERELGRRRDPPSLEQERAAWSQERQRLQARIASLEQEQGGLRQLAALAPPAGGDSEDARLRQAYDKLLRSESHRRALCWQKRYLMILLGGYQETEAMTVRRMAQLTRGGFRRDGRRYLTPEGKFRAAAWVVVAVQRMRFMVDRWRSGHRLALALAGVADPAAPAAVRPPSATSLVSAPACDSPAGRGRDVRDCMVSAPACDDRSARSDAQSDARSIASVSDVCTEDLEPYLARFDALLDRQGLPPQSGHRRQDGGR